MDGQTWGQTGPLIELQGHIPKSMDLWWSTHNYHHHAAIFVFWLHYPWSIPNIHTTATAIIWLLSLYFDHMRHDSGAISVISLQLLLCFLVFVIFQWLLCQKVKYFDLFCSVKYNEGKKWVFLRRGTGKKSREVESAEMAIATGPCTPKTIWFHSFSLSCSQLSPYLPLITYSANMPSHFFEKASDVQATKHWCMLFQKISIQFQGKKK